MDIFKVVFYGGRITLKNLLKNLSIDIIKNLVDLTVDKEKVIKKKLMFCVSVILLVLLNICDLIILRSNMK